LRRRVLIAAFVVVAVGAAAVVVFLRQGRSRTPGPEERRKTAPEIVVAYPEEPPTLNPYLYAGDSNATRDLLRPVLPTLLRIDDGLKYGPMLATRVPGGGDIQVDPFRVTFHLNPKAEWSDGVAITAQDVRFTWELIRNPAFAIADRTAYERVTDVKVEDPQTVTIVLNGPFAGWRDLFSAGDFVLPKHALEGKDFSAELAGSVPVSGGPFRIESFTRGLEIVYTANEAWWGRQPGTERLRVLFVPDIETAVQLLDRERVHVVASTSQVGLTKRLSRVKGVEVTSRYGAAWWEIGFNHERVGPRDAGWRQAFASGFDRSGFAEAVLKEDARLLQHLRPGAKTGAAFNRFGFDSARSKKLLTDAGYRQTGEGIFAKDGKSRFGVSAPGENELSSILEKSLQTGVKRAGLSIEPINPRGEVFYGRTRKDGEFDAGLWERRGTPSMALSAYYHSKNHPPAGLNYARLQSPAVDAALTASENLAAFERTKSDALMSSLADTLPALPLFEIKAYLGRRTGLEGFRPNATIDGPFWNVEDWGPAS
jgi:peptide/nickel transport system substrate-binding protein